ncbi:tetratricopeptide repeat protein [Mesorhizobium sp. VK25A]|uniref:Tetratricopeptide repeat protein n=1 Tax=Mesorhizobium vachelliae TaxID=3072309 RepID=A0ABU4ZXT1_9HYPH|nr:MULTISPECIES: tetratricopeptide repeat protein [unclassified Mesorhizobium]MDX8530213.1 tetratricopeptide repeat protein [Mesorhizobium sp. VK25D]MDX8542190.1 tetratricopeptide repeat protein [Mesorhizobium sp. VK25A]
MADSVSDLAKHARELGLAGDFAAGHALIDRAFRLAGDDPKARAICSLERGRLHNSAGEREKARPLFAEAWRLARQTGAHALAVDAAHMLAIVGTLDEAIEWTASALAYIGEHPEAGTWRGPLLNNLGWSYFDAGRFVDALVLFEQAVELRRSTGEKRELRIARYAAIRTLRALGCLEDALRLAEETVAAAAADGAQAPYVLEELAECRALLGDVSGARESAQHALAVLEQDQAFVRGEPVRLARLRRLAR